jgi:EpsI family protein
MKQLHRAAAALCLMLACSALAAWLTPTILMAEQRSHPLNLEQDVPNAFGPWLAEDTSIGVVNPQAQEVLDRIYTQVLARSYVNAQTGQRIMLSIAYGADQRRREGTQLHQPEICYPAQGFQIEANKATSIQLQGGAIPVRRLETNLGRVRHEMVTYWTMTGDVAVATAIDRKYTEFKYGMSGLVPDGLLFRVSSIGPIPENEYAGQVEFLRDLILGLQPKIRMQLTGI